MATGNNWNLRDGFTDNYDLATSAVREADKQFSSAQKIVENAYALDKTAATQGMEIDRINQENLEKALISRERVGDFEGQQEIQRALESLGTGYADQPVTTEGDAQPEQQNPEIVTSEGKLMPDPTAPINAVKNAQRPPSTRPAARPMTQMERLKAIEPMLASPRARAALRQMVVKESMLEANQLATIAPDEAFNGLIKNGIMKGNPLIANDHGTYTRVMPDGKNKITIDRNEAAAWVGDILNKTNNQYKLIEERRQLAEAAKSRVAVDAQETKNKMSLKTYQTNEEMRAQNAEYGLRTQLERTKAELEAGIIGVKKQAGAYGSTYGRDGNNSEYDTNPAPFDAQSIPANTTPRAAQYDNATPAFNSTIESAARQNNVDPTVFKRLIGSESSFNPSASNGVAFGVAQIYKSNIGDKAGQISMEDAMNPEKALPYAAKLFSGYLKQSGGDYNEALMRYKGATSAEGRKAMQAPINDILSGINSGAKPQAAPAKQEAIPLSKLPFDQIDKYIENEKEILKNGMKENNRKKIETAQQKIDQLTAARTARGGDAKKISGKLNAMKTLIESSLQENPSRADGSTITSEFRRLMDKHNADLKKGTPIDEAKFQAEYDALLSKIRTRK
jgi:soluble lytic murein transglycosylase-like protein